jgi:hypothetical protein
VVSYKHPGNNYRETNVQALTDAIPVGFYSNLTIGVASSRVRERHDTAPENPVYLTDMSSGAHGISQCSCLPSNPPLLTWEATDG